MRLHRSTPLAPPPSDAVAPVVHRRYCVTVGNEVTGGRPDRPQSAGKGIIARAFDWADSKAKVQGDPNSLDPEQRELWRRTRPRYHFWKVLIVAFLFPVVGLSIASETSYLGEAGTVVIVIWVLGLLVYAAYAIWVTRVLWAVSPEAGAGSQPVAAPSPPATWRDAEHMTCQWLRDKLGETSAQVGRGHRDGGVDVESARFVVQVKDWEGNVGGPAVRQIFGVAAARGKTALVVAKSGYTVDALRFADQAGVGLYSYRRGTIEPVNGVARALR